MSVCVCVCVCRASWRGWQHRCEDVLGGGDLGTVAMGVLVTCMSLRQGMLVTWERQRTTERVDDAEQTAQAAAVATGSVDAIATC